MRAEAGRTVLVTGAARGLGRVMALHLAAPGRRVLMTYRTGAEAVEAVAAEARARGAEALPLRADLGRAVEREALMARVGDEAGALHVLIHNVGVYRPAPLLELSLAEWTETLEASCTAVFHLTQLAVPLLRAGAPARVVMVGDSGADRIVARPRATAYHVAKLGVHVLTRSFARVLAPEGITVNQVSPGILENSVDGPGGPIPAGRRGRFDDVLGALDYLLSPEAAYVSGTNLIVSGGWNL